MDMSTSACESGWTVYLDESYIPRNDYTESYRLNSGEYGGGEEEDLSMVSDATSGPPHFQEDEQDCYQRSSSKQNGKYSTSTAKSSSKKSEKRSKKSASRDDQKLSTSKHQMPQHGYGSHHLDDTASSPAMSFSHQVYANDRSSVEQFNYMGYAQDYSATQFQVDASYNNHCAFWQSSIPKDTHTAEPSHFTGRRW